MSPASGLTRPFQFSLWTWNWSHWVNGTRGIHRPFMDKEGSPGEKQWPSCKAGIRQHKLALNSTGNTWNRIWQYLLQRKCYGLGISLLGRVFKDIWTTMLMATLFIMANTCKQPKCASIRHLLNWWKRNEVYLHVLIWKEGLSILLSDQSGVQSRSYSMIQISG